MIALLTLLALMLLGFAVRAGVRPVWRLHLPASVVAGAIGLVAFQLAPRGSTEELAATFKGWTTPLIAVVFAGLLIERTDKSRGIARDVARQAIAAWIVILGQVALGVALVAVWIAPAYGVPTAAGQLIEVGMAGGPGTASAMGDVYAAQFNFAEGKDLGLFVATVGLVYGLVSGIALARYGIRRGWARDPGEATAAFVSGIEPTPRSLGAARTRPDVLDPLTLQILWLGSAFAVGWLLQRAWTLGLSHFDDPENKRQFVDQLAALPLFVFTTFGGWIVREARHALRLERLLDPPTLSRLGGVALEVVIVASISTISLSAISRLFVPTIALLVVGAAWCVFNLLWVSPRLLPRGYWFELGLMNYGFATATTPQSILLLKLADPDVRSGAAETYAAAVPLSAPFVGGGLLTFVGFPLLLSRFGPWSVVVPCALAMALLWCVGRRLARVAPTARAGPI